jgi:succinyl-CoA synthetase alpha subunit
MVMLKKSSSIGPNCRLLLQVKLKLVLCRVLFSKGDCRYVSKSGTLTYEAADQVVGLGITTGGIGGDPIIEQLQRKQLSLMNDPETECICNDR